MANTCTTDYVFEGEGAQIRALHKELDALQKAKPDSKEEGPYVDPSNWLGNIVKKNAWRGSSENKLSWRVQSSRN